MVSIERIDETDSDAIKQFKLRAAKVATESRITAYNFKPRHDDVIITTPPKSGTTWVSQIVHSLRSKGDMNFEDINNIIPYIEIAADYGYTDLNADQGYYPRVYKSHFWYDHCPKGAKTIVVVREPLDAGPSFYYFLADWVFQSADISMNAFLKEFWLSRGASDDPRQEASMWHFIASWYPHRNDPNVLWLHFEDLAADLPGCVALIARFLNIGVDDAELQQIAVTQSSLQEMKKNNSKYDDHVAKAIMNEKIGLPKNAGMNSSKVREGKVGSNRQVLSTELKDAIQQKWEDVVLPVTGYMTYHDMREGINKELGRRF